MNNTHPYLNVYQLPWLDTKPNKYKKEDFEVGDIVLLSDEEHGDTLLEVTDLEVYETPLIRTFDAQHEFLNARYFFGGYSVLMGKVVQVFIPMIHMRFRKKK